MCLIYQMFYCQNKVHICVLTKRDIYTLYKFTIAYKVFFYTQMYTFLHIFYINTFENYKNERPVKYLGTIKA